MPQSLGTPKIQYFDTSTDTFLVGGKLYAYEVGSLTAKNTYVTSVDATAHTNPQSNPIILNTRGEATVWFNGAIKFVLTDSLNNEIWSEDNFGSTSTDILDTNSNPLLVFVTTNNAVNYWSMQNAVVGAGPILASAGADDNIDANITSKADGNLVLDGGDTGDVDINKHSTGNINLHRTTIITGDITVSGNITYTGTIIPPGTTGQFIPIGSCLPYTGATAPAGYLLGDGAAVSRTTYATYFALVGTLYGTGDGTTTFNVPQLQRRVVVGAGGAGTLVLANTVAATGGTETVTLDITQIPAHTHNAQQTTAASTWTAGGLSGWVNPGISTPTLTTTTSSGGGLAHNNMQPSIVLNMIIRVL